MSECLVQSTLLYSVYCFYNRKMPKIILNVALVKNVCFRGVAYLLKFKMFEKKKMPCKNIWFLFRSDFEEISNSNCYQLFNFCF